MILSTLFYIFIVGIIVILVASVLFESRHFIKSGWSWVSNKMFLFPFQILLISLSGLLFYLYYRFSFIPPEGKKKNQWGSTIVDPKNNMITRSKKFYNALNTIFLFIIGVFSLAIFTQFNSIDTPIQPVGWPDYDPNNRCWWFFKKLLRGGVGAMLLGYLGYYFGGTEKTTISQIGGGLGFILALLLNFKTSTALLSSKISKYFSVLFRIFTVILVVFGLLWLVQKYRFISISFSVIIILTVLSVLLFSLYNFLKNNPSWRKFIDTHPLPRILYYIVFLIPCLISFIFEGISLEMGRTPRYVFMILLVEAVLIALYLLIPILIRWLYLHKPAGSSNNRLVDIEKRLETLKHSILQKKKKLNKEQSAVPGITWNEIWLPLPGTPVDPNHRQVMREKLIRLGYTDEGTTVCPPPSPDDTYYNNLKGMAQNAIGMTPNCSITSAITYIITMLPKILEKQQHIEKLTDEYNDLLYEKDDFENIFSTKQLINKPIPSDKMRTDPDWYYENLKKGGKNYNYIYSLSCWVFLHQQASNSNWKNDLYTSIINYGDKPNIAYNANKKKLRITVQTEKDHAKVIYKTTKFPLQKWNNIVLNFDGGTLDVFINKQLVATEKNVIPYISKDNITLGENDGVSGGICNTTYFPSTLGKTKIDLFYDTLKIKNPPIV